MSWQQFAGGAVEFALFEAVQGRLGARAVATKTSAPRPLGAFVNHVDLDFGGSKEQFQLVEFLRGVLLNYSFVSGASRHGYFS